MLNHPEHITDVLHQNTCGVSKVVQITLGEVRQAGAGDQVEVLEGRVQAFAQAGVEVEQRGVAVDQEYGVIGGGFGAGGEATGW